MTRLIIAGVFALGLGVGACGSTGSQVDSSEASAAAFPAMSWSEVSAAMNDGAVLIDARSASQYAEGHIEGAVNVPSGADQAAFAALPSDKSTQLITYCGGPACSASTKVARVAAELGYSQVAEYKGGYPEWKKNQSM